MDQGVLLEGVRVLEFSGDVATRYCGRLFAMMGARVVRAGASHDASLGFGGAAGEAYGAWLDQGKTTTANAAAAHALLIDGHIDLIIAGLGQAEIEAAEAMTNVEPNAPLLLAMTWFAEEGPYGGWIGNDVVLQALTGVTYNFGLEEGPPVTPQGHGPQIAAGVTAFLAAVACLIGRMRGGRQARIDLNVFEAAMCFSEPGAIAYTAAGRAKRLGVNRLYPTYPCSSYRTSDGWVGVTALTPAQWASLCEMIDRPDLAADPRLATTQERLILSQEVDAALAPAFAKRTTNEWVAEGDRRRIPTAPALDQAGLLAAEHWRARESFKRVGGAAGEALAPGLPFRVTSHGSSLALPPLDNADAPPLSGLRVVDFTMGWAGPLANRHFADLGADVVKVESHDYPDWWRGWEKVEKADPPPREVFLNFIALNRNKRDVALDLRSEEGLAAARALIGRADAVFDNFGPGVLDRLGLGPTAQRALAPSIVSVTMGPFGGGGPWQGLRAYGSTVEQASGLPFVNGCEGWPPSQQHNAYGDPVVGLYAASVALACLYARERLGGAHVDLSQVECLFQFGADAFLARQRMSAPLPRTGSRRNTAAPSCNVGCWGTDEWLSVCVDRPAAWPALCRMIGRADWADDPALLDPKQRRARADDIEAAISAWAALLEPEEAAQQLQRAGVPAAPVLRSDRLARNPQLWASGFWRTMERRYIGRHLQGAAPYRIDGDRPALRTPAPLIGEHTDEVLAELAAAGLTKTV